MSVLSTTASVSAGAMVSFTRRWFGYGLVAATLVLIWWGGQVKSHEAGLSVPDWPMSYGMWWPPLVGNVFWEHLHRTVAAAVGLLTVALAIWTSAADSRSWVRQLAWWCVLAVCLQGLLGGLTVIYLLPRPVSMSHAALAQTFLCLVIWLAYSGSREWLHGPARLATLAVTLRGEDVARVGGAARAATIAVFLQLLFGALVRHSEAGLAVPFFPLSAEGALLPEFVTTPVVIHMLHRLFAFVVAALVLRAAWRAARQWTHVAGHALLLAGLVVGQIFLGGLIVWSGKSPPPTSLHVVTGAALLMLCWLMVLRSWKMGRMIETGITG